jgi:hypothetical protein
MDYEHYERKVYNINNLLGDVGGIYTSLSFIGKVTFSIFSDSLFYSAIIASLYWVEKLVKKAKKRKGRKASPRQRNNE